MNAVGVLTIYRTSIGKKIIMAVTGLMMVGFILIHMYGNLKVFNGAVYFNEYAAGLRELGAPIFGHEHLLWVARFGLLGAVGLHVWSALSLTRQNMAGRDTKYATHKKQRASYAALTMRWGGVAILFFIIYHLLHFTVGAPFIHSSFVYGDAYGNLVRGFQNPFNVVFYLVAVGALGMHLYHGTWSMFQTLGFNNRTYDMPIRVLAIGLAVVTTVGFSVVPLSVMFGLVN